MYVASHMRSYGPRRAETGIADRRKKPPKRPNTRMRGSAMAGNALSYRGLLTGLLSKQNQLRTVAERGGLNLASLNGLKNKRKS